LALTPPPPRPPLQPFASSPTVTLALDTSRKWCCGGAVGLVEAILQARVSWPASLRPSFATQRRNPFLPAPITPPPLAPTAAASPFTAARVAQAPSASALRRRLTRSP